MCGICGLVSLTSQAKEKIRQMNLSISHRGPDAEGIWNDIHVSLGHRRLSILDLSPLGSQPMMSHDGNLVLVFNGEIYNFQAIRQELEAKGYRFVSTCDTEVVLYAYQEWGTNAFARFNGMFALAIYSKKENELVLARDHAGIKSLYYSFRNNALLFASETRAFTVYDPNWPKEESWPVHFLSFGFIPQPYTTLKEVFALPKGSYLKVNLNKPLQESAANIEAFNTFAFTNQIETESEALQKVRETVLAAVDRHMISDAPLGIFLSGGIDSSLCALIADHLEHKDLNTLSITFNEATFNEEPFQDIVLQRMRHHNHQAYKVDGKMFMEHLDDVFRAMDQPSWDGVNSYFISKCAHDAGLKAVLSGLGGDELFGGYPSFQRISLLNKMRRMPSFLRSMSRFAPNDAMARLSFLNVDSPYNEYLFLRGAYTPDVTSKITGLSIKEIKIMLSSLDLPGYPQERNGNLAAFMETDVYMGNQLLKDSDFMSMWHSLEVRVPFLDKQLMELLHSIDPKVKFNFSQPKYLLTKAFQDILPDEVVFRKKQGFTFPFGIWLKNNKDYFKALLPDVPLSDKLWAEFLQDKIHWSRIWALMVLKRFHDSI
jgi:asparagine synthase (glutamine-hydrolysing)